MFSKKIGQRDNAMNMKTLLQVYEELRDDAKVKADGFAFLYWSKRCTEILTIMEAGENGKDDNLRGDTHENI
jgi:hypothetical protein